MVSLALRLDIRHNFREAHTEVLAMKERLEAAMPEGTARATTVLGRAVVASVVDRTSMSTEVAERITETSAEGTHGRVGFKPPPPGGWKITPRSGKALAFSWPQRGPGPGEGGKWVFRSVQHPGSRPYALIGRTTLSSETLLRRQYEDEVEDAVSKVGL